MLEFKKKILKTVSFDLHLFEKELMKATKWLASEELEDLQKWCYTNFGEHYKNIMDRCFLKVLVQ